MKSGEVVTPLISRVLVDKSQTEEQYNEDLLTPVTEIPRAILHPEDSLFLDFHGLPIFLIATCHLKINSYYLSWTINPYFLQKSLIKTKRGLPWWRSG